MEGVSPPRNRHEKRKHPNLHITPLQILNSAVSVQNSTSDVKKIEVHSKAYPVNSTARISGAHG
ncbi:hypothetical protein SCFA_90037 [anaerobic digester metagenome]|uniref:Uncharacterized protein n=1 Tax=anaerobic digester metagenome TaxID=1263854 RepID=A0A485M6A8_9ZZZZ